MQKLERNIVEQFGKQLHKRYPWVDIHRKPSASPRLREELKRVLDYVPILQPEIDICIMDKYGHLSAAEVKVFPAEALSFTLPFYEGIGQALALHRYGFDFVSLWFFFYGQVTRDLMKQYGAQTWFFIRNELKLPLDFTFFNAIARNQSYEFQVYQYTSNKDAHELCPFNEFEFVFRHPNPLRDLELPKIIRSKLEPWLRETKSKVT